MKTVYGIGDTKGLDMVANCRDEGALTRFSIRASSNPQRFAFVFEATMTDKLYQIAFGNFAEAQFTPKVLLMKLIIEAKKFRVRHQDDANFDMVTKTLTEELKNE